MACCQGDYGRCVAARVTVVQTEQLYYFIKSICKFTYFATKYFYNVVEIYFEHTSENNFKKKLVAAFLVNQDYIR